MTCYLPHELRKQIKARDTEQFRLHRRILSANVRKKNIYEGSIHPSTPHEAWHHENKMREASAADCWIKLERHFSPHFARKPELTYL
jgi:hypothetical protein